MTTANQQPDIPEWDVADRMKKALRHAGVTVNEMADYLDVALPTMRTWTSGRTKPRTQTLRLWALRCGVPYEWLVSGHVQPASDAREAAGMLTGGGAEAAPGARSSTDRASDYGSEVRRFPALTLPKVDVSADVADDALAA